jgi:hypothetical protein
MLILLAILSLFLFMVGAFLALQALAQLQRSSLLSIPVSRAAQLKEGRCKVRGRLVPLEQPLLSPVTNQACIYYRLRVDEEGRKWKSSGGGEPDPWTTIIVAILFGLIGALIYRIFGGGEGGSKVVTSWQNILDEADSVDLTIEDATGSVAVDLGNAEVTTKDKARVMTDLHRAAPIHLQDWLRKAYDMHTVDKRGKLRTLKLVEETLKAGDKVTVVGHVGPGPDGRLCFQAAAGPLVVIERDASKQGQSIRRWAIGNAIGAGSSVLVAVATLIVAGVWFR